MNSNIVMGSECMGLYRKRVLSFQAAQVDAMLYLNLLDLIDILNKAYPKASITERCHIAHYKNFYEKLLEEVKLFYKPSQIEKLEKFYFEILSI